MGQADPGITASYHASVDLGKKPHFTYTFIAMIVRRTEGQSSKKGRGEVRTMKSFFSVKLQQNSSTASKGNSTNTC